VTIACRRHRAISADLYDSGCSVLAAVTFPDQVVL
jgi:hypothetical protein